MSTDLMADLERLAKFPAGTPADPTKNMSPEQKAEWEAMKDKHGDKFKTAGASAVDRAKKRGEWNLVVYKSRATRWDYFLENPTGGGGGSSSYTSLKAAIAAGTTNKNFRGATKVWLIQAVWDAETEDYRVEKTGWIPVQSATPRNLSNDKMWEMQTRSAGCEKLPAGPMRDNCEKGAPGKKAEEYDFLQDARAMGVSPRELRRQMEELERMEPPEPSEPSDPSPSFSNKERVTFSNNCRVVLFAAFLKGKAPDRLVWDWAFKLPNNYAWYSMSWEDKNTLEREFKKHRRLINKIPPELAGALVGPTYLPGDHKRPQYRVRTPGWAAARRLFETFEWEHNLFIVGPEGPPQIQPRRATDFLADMFKSGPEDDIEFPWETEVVDSENDGDLFAEEFDLLANPVLRNRLKKRADDEGDLFHDPFKLVDASEDADEKEANPVLRNRLKGKGKRADDEDEKEAGFEKGKPADPTENMSDEDKAEWNKQKALNKDKFKSAGDFFADEFDLLAEGCPDNLDEEACGEWEANTERHKDKFKAAGCEKLPNEAMQQQCEDKKEEGKKASREERYVKIPLLGVSPYDMDEWVEVASKHLGRFFRCYSTNTVGDVQVLNVTHAASNVDLDEWIREMSAAFNDLVRLLIRRGAKVDKGMLGSYNRAFAQAVKGMSKQADFEPGEVDDTSPLDGDRSEDASDLPDGEGNREKRASELTDQASRLAHYLQDMGVPREHLGVRTATTVDVEVVSWWIPRTASEAISDDAGMSDAFMDGMKRMGFRPVGRSSWGSGMVTVTTDVSRRGTTIEVTVPNTGRTAAQAPGGLYGFPKSVQADCEASARKVARQAAVLAKRIYAKDAKVADFLGTHHKRAKSLTAKVLLNAMQEIGPRTASEKADEEPGSQLPDEGESAPGKTASDYGLYGFRAKTASLGLGACAELREATGRMAYDLHKRRASRHAQITSFLKTHCKEAKCASSQLLSDCYPGADCKVASAPVSVNDWLSWED
jgi:hypothetical protein